MRRSPKRESERVTIRQVAQAASVSITTVSNALNGHSQSLTEETLRRVQETIRALDYHPSGVARSLVTRRSATIGLIVSEIETPLFLNGLSIIEPLARRAQYNVLVCHASSLHDERQGVNLLLEKEVEGIVFLSNSVEYEDSHIRALQESKLPVVFINRTTLYPGFDHINWDNAGGVAMAVQHLVELGHRRIAHLRGPEHRRSSEERYRGYRLALEQHGLPYRDDYVRPGDYTGPEEERRQFTLELLSLLQPPTAIIAADDTVAAIAMKAVQESGLRVPQDVAIVGIDDQPFCKYLNPSLTTIQLPVADAGKRAIQTLLDRLAGRRQTTEHVLLPCPLIVRESCGAAR